MKNLIYILILTLTSGSLFAQSGLRFRKPTTTDNITWKFKSVTSGVDAYITVVKQVNATLDAIDDSSKYAYAWNPFIKYTNTPARSTDSSYVEFKIEFKKISDNSAQILNTVAMTVIDCDGGSNGLNVYREMVKTSLPATSKGMLGTLLTAVTGGGWLTNIAGPNDYSSMDTSNFLAMAQINYSNVSSYNVKVGVIGRIAGGKTREASFYFKGFTPLTIALPVKLIDFKATNNNQVNTLKWTTTQEYNMNNFEVYRSVDGKTFTMAGTVKATGFSQSNNNYVFADKKSVIENEGNVFYKLRMVDNNGDYKWSSVVMINNTKTAEDNNTTKIGNVYPNPTKGMLNVNFTAVAGADFSIQVVDMFGKTIQSFQNSDLNADNSLSLDLTDLSNGVYFIKVNNNDGSSASSKFVKN